MKLQSSGGMAVEMSDHDYGDFLARYGVRAREMALTEAGRVYKHRKLLKLIHAQKLTDEQREQVEHVAHAVARQFAIYNEIRDRGYGSHVDRALAGRIMPESWDRIVSQASAAIGEVEVDDSARTYAMQNLGFYVDKDLDHSMRIVRGRESWKITVPDGWGGEAMKNGAPLGFDIH